MKSKGNIVRQTPSRYIHVRFLWCQYAPSSWPSWPWRARWDLEQARKAAAVEVKDVELDELSQQRGSTS